MIPPNVDEINPFPEWYMSGMECLWNMVAAPCPKRGQTWHIGPYEVVILRANWLTVTMTWPGDTTKTMLTADFKIGYRLSNT